MAEGSAGPKHLENMSQYIGYTYFKVVHFWHIQAYCHVSDNISEKNPEALFLAVISNLGPNDPDTQKRAKKSKK